MRHLVHFALSVYPPWWRRRYGEETSDLADELLADPGAHRWRLFGSLLFGSVIAWAQIRRRGDYLRPLSSPNAWGMVPRGSHRDFLGNRGLWPKSESEFEPDEELLGVLDGQVGSRYLNRLPWTYVGMLCVAVVDFLLLPHWPSSRSWLITSAIFLMAAVTLKKLTGSRLVAVAITSHGILIFRSTVSGRTGRLVCRMPAAAPKLIRETKSWQKVRLGDRTVWFQHGSQPLLGWMTRSLSAETGKGTMSPINPFGNLR